MSLARCQSFTMPPCSTGLSTSLDVVQHPVMLTPEEKATFNGARVSAIISDQRKSPSQLANLPLDQLCATVQAVDVQYRAAVANYINFYMQALNKDLHTVERCENYLQDHRFVRMQMSCSHYYWTVVAFFIPSQNWSDQVRQLSARHQYNQRACRAGSAHRRALLVKVDTLEEERLKAARSKIINRATLLLETVKKLEADGETSLDKTQELEQLNLVFSALFPGETLSINETNVAEYTTHLLGE